MHGAVRFLIDSHLAPSFTPCERPRCHLSRFETLLVTVNIGNIRPTDSRVRVRART